jgi:hypothetical protein
MGYALIDVEITKFKVLGMMSPLVIGTEKFFSITRSPNMQWGWEKFTGSANAQPMPITTKPMDRKILDGGPVLQISSENAREPIYIAGQVTVLGRTQALHVSVTSSGFDLQFGTGVLGGTVDFTGSSQLTYSSGLKSNYSISCVPTATILPAMEFTSQLGRFTFPQKALAFKELAAQMLFGYDIGWAGSSGGFRLTLAGTMRALGQEWKLIPLTLSQTISAADFDSIEKIMTRFVARFKENFSQLFRNFMLTLSSNLRAAIDFVYKQWAFSDFDLVQSIGAVLQLPDWRPLAHEVIKMSQPGLDGAVQLFKQLGLRAESVARMAKECFNILNRAAERVTQKLKQFGYEAQDSMSALKNVFGYSDVKLTMSEMRRCGFQVKEIMAAAKVVFDARWKTFLSWGKDIGMAVNEIKNFFDEIS